MTRAEILHRYPNASSSFIKANLQADPPRVSADDKKQAQGSALVRPETGAGQRLRCFEIVFTVYATRPADWDGWSIKELQDAVVASGILCGDAWNQLEGRVRSRKVHTKEEERTEVEIFEITNNL